MATKTKAKAAPTAEPAAETERPKRRGPGNPKTSPWYSTPSSQRNRRQVALTIPDDVRAALAKMAEADGVALSRWLERQIRTEAAKRGIELAAEE